MHYVDTKNVDAAMFAFTAGEYSTPNLQYIRKLISLLKYKMACALNIWERLQLSV